MFVHSADPEEIVVFGKALHRMTRNVAHVQDIGPNGRRSVAPDYFVTRHVGFLIHIPFEVGVIG